MSIKLLTLSALAATTAFAAPASVRTRQGLSPNAATVNNNIQGWQDDIADVNAFLNVASTLSPAQLAEEASQLLLTTPGNAGNEPTRLMALTPLIAPDDAVAQTAAATLGQIFGGVLGNLTTIVSSPGDAAAVASAVEQINCLRCNFVLPDINLVYAGAVESNPGATMAVTTGPNVCPVPFTGSSPCV